MVAPDFRKLREILVVDIVTRELAEFGIFNILVGKTIAKLNIVPDIMFENNGVVVIIEVDEHRHRAYQQTAEKERTQKLRVFFESLRIIRINPDTSTARSVPMLSKNFIHLPQKPPEKTIRYWPGEIEWRTIQIRKCIHNVIAQIHCDIQLKRLSAFEEFRLFFD